MMSDEAQLLSVAHAIAERLPVSWAEAEVTISGSDPSTSETLRELRIIAQIAALHRATTPAASGDMWGSLRLDEHIAHGSYGDVYRAVDTRLDREVALKLLRAPDHAADVRGTAVVDEARLLARVRHPNVVTIHGADRLDGRVGLWMEFVRGRTLEEMVWRDGPLEPAQVNRIAVDVCRALAAVHDAGLLHRDIKAKNVMCEDGGRIVLMDFGAGRETGADASDMTGTPLYLAPEVLAGESASIQSDLYSVGVLLFHLLTRSYPIEGRTLDEIRAAHAAGTLRNPGHGRPDVPPRLAGAIERALSVEPSRRFESAPAMEQALAPTEVAAAPRGRPLVHIMAGLVSAVAVGLAGIGWYSREAAPAPLGDRAVWKGEGVDLFGTVSDDGRYVTYVDWNIGENLVLRDLMSGTSRPLTRNTRRSEFGTAWWSVMARDGTRVAYMWAPAGGLRAELHLMTLVNGGPGPDRIIWRSPTDDENMQPYEWSPDERWLLVHRLRRQARERDIGTLDLDTGELRVITTLPNRLRTGDMALSPDGRYIAYEIAEVGAPGDIHVVRIEDGLDQTVVSGPGRNGVMGWSRTGNLLFASDRSGKLGLWALPIADGVPLGSPVHVKDIGSDTSLGLTANDTLYVWHHSVALSFRTASFDLAGGRVNESAPGYVEHFIESRGRHDWSADGHVLAFVDCGRTSGGGCAITVRNAQTGETWAVPHSLNYAWYPRLSPDGRSLITHGVDRRQNPGIYLIDAGTGATSLITGDVPRQQFSLEWSADGRSIYLFRGGGVDHTPARLVQRELATGREREVFRTTLPDVREIRLSPDGAHVAFRTTTSDGYAIVVARRDGGEPRSVMAAALPDLIDWRIEWTPDSRALLAKKGPLPTRFSGVWLAPINGTPRRLDIDTSRWDGDGFAQLDPTGRRLSYVAAAGEPGAQVWALENFLQAPGSR